MSTFAASVGAYTVLTALVLAGVDRAGRPRTLPEALASHRVLPATLVRLTATVVTVAEVGLAAALVAGLAGAEELLPVALAGSGVLFTGYAGYAWYVIATGRSGPCGCGRAEVPMSGWVVGRALVLATLAFGPLALGPGAVLGLAAPEAGLLLVLLAAATFGVLLHHLPAALHEPVPEAEATE